MGDGLTSDSQQQQQQAGSSSNGGAANVVAAAVAEQPRQRCEQPQQEASQQHSEGVVCEPEDFQLEQGELSFVERCKPAAAADVFRCAACTRPECQVRCCWRALLAA